MREHNGMQIDDYLYDSVSITPEAIQEEFARVALDLAFWNARYADVLRVHRLAEMDEKRTRAVLYIRHRSLLQDAANTSALEGVGEVDAKGKPKPVKVERVTEAQVDAAVLLDKKMHEAEIAAIEAEVERERVRGVLDAVRAKREMVVSLGAHLRAELAGDPMLRTQTANQRAMRANNG